MKYINKRSVLAFIVAIIAFGYLKVSEPIHAEDNTNLVEDSFGIPMIHVPEGTFEFGASQSVLETLCRENDAPPNCLDDSDLPFAENVTVYSFWIDHHEVTREDYENCVEASYCEPISFNEESSALSTLPITDITWYQALFFCQWRSARLPTEIEWEYAASGPENYSLPWGTNNIDEIPINENSAIPIGSTKTDTTWIGAIDMGHNVQEWVEDRFIPYHGLEDSEVIRYRADTWRVIRGGGWATNRNAVLTFSRQGFDANTPSPGIGFRCARSSNPE